MAGKTAILSVRIISDADRGAAGLTRTARAVGVLEKSAQRGGASLRGMAAATPRILAMGAAIITLSAAVVTGIGHISAFAAALAPLGGLFLALPGIIAGAAVGIAVVAMAMKDAGKHLGDLGPKFAAIQKHVSAQFWERAAGPIRSLALSVLPTLDRALTNSGRILGTAFASSANAAKTTLSSVLGPALSNINLGFLNAAKGAAPFTRAILNLTAAGTEVLPRLGNAVARVAGRFDKWIGDAAADGRLVGWINGGITALGQLGSIVGSIGRIIGSVFKGLSTGGTLGTMAASLREVADAMGSVAGQKVMAQVMGAAGNVMRGIAPGVRALASSLTSLGPTVQAVSKQIGPVLTPVLTALGGVIRTLAPHVTSLVNVLGPALAKAFGVLGPVLSKIAAQLGPIVVMLGKGLAQVITALAPKLAGVGKAFAGLLAAVRPLLAIVLPVLVPALKLLGSILLTAVKGAIEGVTQVIKGVTQILSGLVTFIKGVFTGDWGMAWEGLKTVAAGIFNAIVGAIKTWLNVTILGVFRGGLLRLAGMWRGGLTGLRTIASNVWTAIKGFFTSGINGAKSIVTGGLTGIRTYFTSQLNRLRFVAGAVWAAIRLVFARYIGIVRGVVSAGVSFIRNIFTRQIGALRSIASSVWAAVRGFFSRGIAGARAVVSAGVRFIRSTFSSGMNALRSIASNVMGAVTRAISGGMSRVRSFVSSGMTRVKSIFSKAWSAIRTTATNGISNVIGVVRRLPGRIKGAIGGLVSNFTNMGRDMMKGLANGIKNAGGLVSDMVTKTVKKAVAWAKKWLGIASPSKVFADIGRDTGRGFVVGIDRMQSKTASAMRGMVAPPPVPRLTPHASTARGAAAGGTTINITVNGATDKLAAAREIEQLLRTRQIAFGGAR